MTSGTEMVVGSGFTALLISEPFPMTLDQVHMSYTLVERYLCWLTGLEAFFSLPICYC